MAQNPAVRLYSAVLDCPDAQALAEFYSSLTGWMVVFSSEEYAVIAPAGTAQGAYPGITFQQNPAYVPPVWPEQPGMQQQMAHLDFMAEDVETAIELAKELGASVAPEQFSDSWTVMLDPAGHPFCLLDQRKMLGDAPCMLL
ncbi:MAG: VOC family protein [Clostridia bacterium]|nr:VOC family protein [Clostridia bacterium]